MASLLAQATAGTPKVSPYSPTTPKITPTTVLPTANKSVDPNAFRSVVPSASVGVKATSPTTSIKPPATTLPAAQKAPVQPNTNTKDVITDPVTGKSYSIGSSGGYEPVDIASQTNTSTPTYPGLVGQNILAKQNAATPTSNTPTYAGLVSSLADTAAGINATAGNIGKYGQVTKEEQDAKNKLAGIPGLTGSTTANIENHPSDFAFQMGREAVAGRNIEAMRQSLADQSTAYATTREANTQAYTGQANAENQAAGAYGTAAGYAAPQITSPGQAVFNPVSGTYSSASSNGGSAATAPSGIDQAAWDQYIQAYASGNVAAIPSAITGNANLAGQLQSAVQAANPGFDYASATGAAGARNSNAGTTGTYSTGVAAAGGAQATQAYNLSNALYGAADTQAKTLQNILATTGINSSGSTDYNTAINQLSSRLGSANQAQFVTALTELQTMYSNLLQAGGGTPTDNDAKSLAILSPNSTPAQINGAIYQLQLAAQAKLNGQKQLADLYNNQLGVGNSSNSNQTGTVQTKAGAVNTNW